MQIEKYHTTPQIQRNIECPQVETYRQVGVTLPAVYPLVTIDDEKTGITQTFEAFAP